MNYTEDEFTFSKRLNHLTAVKEKEKKHTKREYIRLEETAESIRCQIDSISNKETNSNNQDSQSQTSSALKSELLIQDRFTVKFLRRNIVVDLDRTFIDIMDMQKYQTTLKSMHSLIRKSFCKEGDMH